MDDSLPLVQFVHWMDRIIESSKLVCSTQRTESNVDQKSSRGFEDQLIKDLKKYNNGIQEVFKTKLEDIKNSLGMTIQKSMEKQTEKLTKEFLELKRSNNGIQEVLETKLEDVKNCLGITNQESVHLNEKLDELIQNSNESSKQLGHSFDNSLLRSEKQLEDMKECIGKSSYQVIKSIEEAIAAMVCRDFHYFFLFFL